MKELFKNLGANNKETETFLKLLELGAQPVSVVARHIGIPRPTMYLILENLKKLNLVDEFEHGGIKYFKCIPVKEIGDVLELKKIKIRETSDLLEKNIADLEKLENRLSITPKVKFFEGKDEVTKAYENILKEKTFMAIFNPEVVKKTMPVYLTKVAETIKKNALQVRELVTDCKESKNYIKKYNSKNHQIKCLPKNMIFHSDTIICEDKIYMIAYGESEVSATEIHNKSLAQTQKAFFEKLWNL